MNSDPWSNILFQADFHAKYNGQKSECMEESARIIAKAFGNCMTDRCSPFPYTVYFLILVEFLNRTSPPDQSRKWGVYYVVGLVLKCYFRASQTSGFLYVHCCKPALFLFLLLGQTNISIKKRLTRFGSKHRYTPTFCISTITSSKHWFRLWNILLHNALQGHS